MSLVLLTLVSFILFPPLAAFLLLWMAIGRRETNPLLARVAIVLLIGMILSGVAIYLYMSNGMTW